MAILDRIVCLLSLAGLVGVLAVAIAAASYAAAVGVGALFQW